ncbi:LemA family protein [Dissulfurispira sp.]|uniref:LemA family protein n=1 Tax=Dissulfurispira sp. TaxID=2817609 RepID=UPI002FDB4337
MSTLAIATIITVAAFFFLAVALFNTLISRKNRVSYAFSSIDAMLKKRYDLIPNLVTVVEKYMTYEKKVLEELTLLRAKAVSGNIDDEERITLDKQISKVLRSIIAVAENYPALKASENFLHLQKSLNEIEEQISASRRAYNAAVTDYNNGVEMFPLNIAARIMGYRQKPWFEIPDEERKPVVIK